MTKYLQQSVRWVALLTLVSAVYIAGIVPRVEGTSNHGAERNPVYIVNDQGIQYVAPNANAYLPSPTIQKWVNGFQDIHIREHAFQLWAAITAPSGQFYSVVDTSGNRTKVQLAVFDTWFDEYEIFHAAPHCPADLGQACLSTHHYHLARQLTASVGGGAEVLAFNKYSLEFKTFVDKNKYYDERTLIDLNASFGRSNTPLDQRFIGFPDEKATMLKPSYFVIKKDHPTLMPYWKGPGLSITGTSDPRRPILSTWQQFVVVDPTGTAKVGSTAEIYTKDGLKEMDLSGYKIVGLDHFDWLPMSKNDVAYIKGGNVFNLWGLKSADLEAGDLALLVAMHITTAEFGSWTWQTFWWRPDPVSDSGGDVKAPFTYYDTAQAYYFTNKDGKAHIAFNPYLESPIEGPIFFEAGMRGADSNCMSCHHMAAFPTLSKDSNPAYLLQGSYWDHGPILGTEQFFNNRLKTRFMWGMVLFDQQQKKMK